MSASEHMNDNDRVMQGLAWLTATLPTLVAEDFPGGSEITTVTCNGYCVDIQVNDRATAGRIADRLALTDHFAGGDDTFLMETWKGAAGDTKVTVAFWTRRPAVAAAS